MSARRPDHTIRRRTLCPTKACVLLRVAALVSAAAHPSPPAQSLFRTRSTMICLLTMSMSCLGDAGLAAAAHTPLLPPDHETDT